MLRYLDINSEFILFYFIYLFIVVLVLLETFSNVLLCYNYYYLINLIFNPYNETDMTMNIRSHTYNCRT